ncbi:hypothetical protein SYNTR_2216 [Candidatus Syntrophocurvum alkaliphilum]|uniref:Energy-coupling factor transporter transmembrane protein EcfT n=1 Tax=Candidatus Syntrophocurvum alkaliphilum TaxID=2293317 RepID=A0A6I6DM32_9FIRM|nr:hypothetical protein SYNTR_2216 [Candidatus Syntrophocurvum alkaliphilum]
MISGINFGQYIPENSYLHQMDPRTKIIVTMSGVIAAISLQTTIELVVLLGINIVLIILSKVPITTYLKGLKPFIIIIAIMFLIQAFFTPGEPVINIYLENINISKEGITFAYILSIKLIIIILFALLLTTTTSSMSLTYGLEKILNPLKRLGMPVHEIIMIMTIALRFLPMLSEESQRIIQVQNARGTDFKTKNIYKRVKNLLAIITPLTINAFRRAETLAEAMESRAYTGGQGRTRLNEPNMTKLDYTVIALIIFMWIVLLLLR